MCTSNSNNDKAQLLINTNDSIVNLHCDNTNVFRQLQLFTLDLPQSVFTILLYSQIIFFLQSVARIKMSYKERCGKGETNSQQLMDHWEMMYKIKHREEIENRDNFDS